VNSEALELSTGDCELLLASQDIGRIAVIDNGFPLVFPINYRIASFGGKIVIAIRTRTDNVIDRLGRAVCFEIDGIDASHDGGWSVLVRGTLVESSPEPDLDTHPINSEGRDAWRVIVPTHISGRRLYNRAVRWSFHPAGYL
jgi:nitroimidazol reductase NimA-like FMN-containing flavoprotein (pyridoxamine 5'-phosphate oxidase superfamily)